MLKGEQHTKFLYILKNGIELSKTFEVKSNNSQTGKTVDLQRAKAIEEFMNQLNKNQ